jgi:hypothetical protein
MAVEQAHARPRLRRRSSLAAAVILVVAASGCELGRLGRREPGRLHLPPAVPPIALAGIDVSAWLADHPHVEQDPAYAAWLEELEGGADTILATVRALLGSTFEVRDEENAPLLRAEVTEFNPGRQDPLGSGTGHIALHVELLSTDGEPLGDPLEVTGSSPLGVRHAYASCARDIVRLVRARHPRTLAAAPAR